MWTFTRRDILKAGAIVVGSSACRPLPLGYTPVVAPWTPKKRSTSLYAKAIAQAHDLAEAAYVDRSTPMSDALLKMDYLAHHAITFNPDKSLQLGPKFAAQFFHRGHFHKKTVEIYTVPTSGEPQRVTYDDSVFTMTGDFAGTPVPSDVGYAGFRLHFPFESAPKPYGETNEFLVFLDASYFRLRGEHENYGQSCRGIAINTGAPGPEEFPDFTAFWLIEPEGYEDFIEIVALLDGPSVSGAYRFRAHPGATVVVDVEATLFPRAEVETFGIAPLTSMFVHGSNGPVGHFDDFRPSVHDSDGLFLRTTTEPAAWRPLINGRPAPRTSSFRTGELRGFGLLQRDRNYYDYLDIGARHEDRPGVMVDPVRGFASGAVRLYEIPSPEEYMDNIVAYFVSDAKPPLRQPCEVAYRLSTVANEPVSTLPRVVSTRIGNADRMRPTEVEYPGRRLYFIDWEGEGLPADKHAPVEPIVTASTGVVVLPKAERVPQTGGWRCWFEHRPSGTDVAELRAHLVLNGRQIVETWLYGP